MNFLYDWMKNIIIFMILITVILNLLGKSNYRKYMGLVSGLLLVLLVITPIISVIGDEDFLNFSLNAHASLVEAEDISDGLFKMEEKRDDAMFDAYKEVLKGQTEKLLAEKGLVLHEMTIAVNDDKESLEFGTIHAISLEASYLKTSDKILITKEIKPIEIGQIQITGEEEKEQKSEQTSLSPMEINIKNVLADFYNISSNNINISIREDHDGER